MSDHYHEGYLNIDRILARENQLLIWGANSHSYYLTRFCELFQIPFTLVDLDPDKRKHLFPEYQILNVSDISTLVVDDYIVVVCADEKRFGSEIIKIANQSGFFNIKFFGDFKKELQKYSGIDMPNFGACTRDKYRIKNSKKALVLLPGFALGGAENQAFILAKVLQCSGVDCCLLSLFDASFNCPKFVARLEESNINWENLPSLENPTVFKNEAFSETEFGWLFLHTLTMSFHQINELVRYIKVNAVERVISFLDGANILSGIVVRALGDLKAVLSFRSLAPYHLVSSEDVNPFMFDLTVMRNIYRNLWRGEQIRFYANSTKGRDSYAEWLAIPKSEISVIYNATETTDTLPIVKQKNDAEYGRIEIVGVMRLEEVKGPDVFLRVIQQLKCAELPFHATLVGGGSMLDEMEKMRGALQLIDVLSLVGEHSCPSDFLQRADLLLHTSRVEGLPNALIEAQMHCCHVVCTNAGSSFEALSPCYHQYLAEVENVSRLADNVLALAKQADSTKVAMLKEAKRWASERFSMSALHKNVESEFNLVVERVE